MSNPGMQLVGREGHPPSFVYEARRETRGWGCLFSRFLIRGFGFGSFSPEAPSVLSCSSDSVHFMLTLPVLLCDVANRTLLLPGMAMLMSEACRVVR